MIISLCDTGLLNLCTNSIQDREDNINKDEEEFLKETGDELKGIKTRSMIKKDKEEKMKGVFQGRLTRGKLKALEDEIRGVVHE